MEAPQTPYRHAGAKLERRAARGRTGRAALVALCLTVLAGGLVTLTALALQTRGDAAPLGDRLDARARVLAAGLDPLRPLAARQRLRDAGAAATLLDRDGRVVARTGAPALWRAGGADPLERVATLGAGFTVGGGVAQAEAATASGGRLRLRAALPAGAGPSSGDIGALAALVALLALVAAGRAARRAHRRAVGLERLRVAAESVAGGRAGAPPADVSAELAPVAAAVAGAGRRIGDLQDAAEARFDAAAAALGPLPVAAAARTPLGGRVRNGALEHLVRSLSAEDAHAVEDAVREGLGAGGPCARRLALVDGRTLEAEAWPVTGGRVVALTERTEQDRLARFRRRVTGSAARHLHAPISEVQALASDLHAHVPAGVAPSVARILAAADRMERLVSALLRGTDGDPMARPPRPAPMGAAGLLWGLGRRHAEALEARQLRLHPSVEDPLPSLHADPAVVEEVLGLLMDNAIAWTPRGGDVHLSARAGASGGVAIEVRDSGPGMPPEEVAGLTERFARGAAAAVRPGAGLGLASADALARRLGGRLVLAPGPGGRATLELPAAPAPPPGGAPAPGDAPAAAAVA